MNAHRPRSKRNRVAITSAPSGFGRFAIAALLTLSLLAAAGLPTDALAQSAWNRRVEAISVVPDPADPLRADVHVVLRILGDGSSSVPFDVSTGIQLSINGTTVGLQQVTVAGDPGGLPCSDASECGGGCGTGAVDGQSMTLLCLADGACDPICDCKCSFPSFDSSFPGMSLMPGDEIMVILFPAPGALPDADPSDDTMVITWESTIFWDRQIDTLELVESSAAPGTYDVNVGGTIFHDGLMQFLGTGGQADLGMELELQVNGTAVATSPIDFEPFPLAPACLCSNACATWDGQTHTCLPYVLGECHCGWPWIDVFPGQPISAGDVLRVFLRPTPGALPELPGFEDDDEMSLAIPTGVEAIAEPGGRQLEQNRPNPFRKSTTIAFSTAGESPVSLEVFDLQGRRLSTLIDGDVMAAGTRHIATWDGATSTGDRAPTGIYFYRLTADGTTRTRKMTLTR